MTKSAVIKLTMQSACLGRETEIRILFPQNWIGSPRLKAGKRAADKLKVLWLIHGGTDDSSCWIHNTMLTVFAEQYPNLIIIMPTVYDFHSFRRMGDYYGFVSDELPKFIYRIFPASEKREDNFIAGLSMGGYFSWRIAMNCPERYSCLGSFSSPLDIAEDMRLRHSGATDYPSSKDICGNPDRDLFVRIAENQEKHLEMPRIYQSCGIEDMTYLLNARMRDYLDQKEIPHTYEEWPGEHTWRFWNQSIEKFLAWLPLQDRGAADADAC